nr:HAD hydrolase-like protein [Variovorax boronicumulans]
MVYKLRTVDVWDTLLRRDCHPESIKMAMANHLFLRHRAHMVAQGQDARSLYQLRLQAEQALATAARAGGQDDEYVLSDVVQSWYRSALNDEPSPAEVERLVQLEFEMEVARSRPDPEILAFLQDHPAEQTIFLSDFYMRGEMLHDLLVRKGLGGSIPAGLVSCDLGVNKRSGRIYEHLHRAYGVAPAEHVHIGDNLWSDVEAARKLGIHAVHYAPQALHSARLEQESHFGSRDGLFALLRDQIQAACAEATAGMPAEDATAWRVGAEAAPLFVGLALWLAEESVARQLDGLHFLSREGEFLHRVYAVLFPARRHCGHALAPHGLLELSRLATFTASLASSSMRDVSRMWSLFGSQQVRGLLSTLGLPVDRLAGPLAASALSLDDRLEKPDVDPRVAALFASPEFKAALEESIAEQRSSLLTYLAQRGVGTSGRIGLVDVGWRGTIQDHLAALLPNLQTHGLYLGLRRFINPQPPNAEKAAYGPNENLEGAISPLFESFAVIEMLCMSPGGSVVGFEPDGLGAVAPVRRVLQEEDEVLAGFVARFQEGALCAAAHWREAIERHALGAVELRPLALRVWAHLHGKPDRELLRAFMQAPQQDLFGFGDVFRRDRVPALRTLMLAPLIKARRRELADFVRRVQWPAAVAGFDELGWWHRQALTAIFMSANQLRRARTMLRRHL